MDHWFCSDHHLGHANIIRFCDRPFANPNEMTEKLIDFHNQFVKPQDHVSFLGDVTMERGGRVQQERFIWLMSRFNGHKRLYLGNHDHFPIEVYLRAGFEKIYATWRDQSGLLFSHIPIHPTSFSSAKANIHGHIHDQKSPPPVIYDDPKTGKKVVKPYINICVEVTGYRPLHLDEVNKKVELAIEAGERGGRYED